MASSNNPAKPVHILFVGAGAVGCFYASRLHHPSQNVYASLIARSNYKAIIAAGGKVELQTHSFGNYTFAPYAVFPNIDAAVPSASSSSSGPEAAVGGEKSAGTGTPPSEGWDYIIVTTKALPDRTDDAAMVAPLVSEKSCLVLIQNGVGVEAPYRARFPRNPIVSAVTVISAEQIRNGVVRQNRWTRISLGPYGHGLGAPPGVGDQAGEEPVARLGDERMRALARWWTALGGIRDVETHSELELQTIRWHKLCINAAFNPTAVLSGGRGNADQLTDPELREHVLGIMHEIRDAAPLVLGKPLPDTLASPEKIVKSTERNTGGRPSMLLDWEAGRPMEIEVILGNPVRIARAKGVQMPRLQSLYACLRSMQRMREEREEREKGKGKL
ncbi:2-dehydropantoate 2-reductase [Annulohypoxylon truncatum]|uniref:2-dehydropantoate 2-reductase n=1 Tax=Annulohypoxylon truncatum TaxID=327061 RepID=UPI002007E4B8|nr:2-dehydropantoate 2-reductase [Annulohypoxylon truncatum]KAI1208590.1 2-dehydropantoate 2-reductase [Annulohypoxylon truncatum]